MNVKVRANFRLEEDDNIIGLVDLISHVSYSIPDMNGFRKPKSFDVILGSSSSLDKFLKDCENFNIKSIVMKAIQKEVRLDIMNRLKGHAQLTDKEQLSQVLNMLNQMKFDFDYDVRAVKGDIKEETDTKCLDVSKFGQVHGDFFNLHSEGCKLKSNINSEKEV